MDQEKIGKFIKDIRKKNNLTQKELAEKLGVTYQAVSKWENGKNIPDISLIKQISKEFNIDISDILEGEIIKEKKNNYMLKIIIIFSIIIVLLIVIIIFRDSSFNFKTHESNCDDFTITGSLAYNKNKSSIYISNINYCGGNDEVKYKKIECVLYEKNGNMEIKIDKWESKNIKLEDFLKDISFNVDNYSQACKNYSDNSLYLKISATDSNNKITSYEVPLTISNNCK